MSERGFLFFSVWYLAKLRHHAEMLCLKHYFNNGAHYISIKCQTFLTTYYNQSTHRSLSKTMFNNQTDNPSQYEAIPVCLLTEVSSDQKA